MQSPQLREGPELSSEKALSWAPVLAVSMPGLKSDTFVSQYATIMTMINIYQESCNKSQLGRYFRGPHEHSLI